MLYVHILGQTHVDLDGVHGIGELAFDVGLLFSGAHHPQGCCEAARQEGDEDGRDSQHHQELYERKAGALSRPSPGRG